MGIVAVALGGAVGAVLRYGVGFMTAAVAGADYPLGTLVVNVTGSLFLGFFAGAVEVSALSPTVRLAVMTGCLGAFTTFSTFSLDTVNLVRSGHVPVAILNVGANVLLGLAALVVGLLLSRLTLAGG